ncbi:MAG: trimethylamine methyltransferase family protein, partial [Gammaproteobacteria bacterium]|nr:trimethylamine methyltransferase family protein [Gammaproteobacteria bacterium]
MSSHPQHRRHPGRKRRGGRAAKFAARRRGTAKELAAWIDRSIPFFDVLDTEALELIEHNADTVLEEIGIEFRAFPRALELLKEAGADVDGERVRFPRGMCRSLVQTTAPREYTQHARNPRRSTIIGGAHTVMVPAYGSPFVQDLDQGRRYATLEDFQNFVKLAFMSPGLHHSGGTICEPVDVPVNKRHFDMIYSHIRYSDKPFMGSVTHPERAEDTVAMARIVFGEDFVANNTVLTSLINANSPMCFDATMLGAATVYAENNQATVISPFLLAGAMSPVTAAGTLTQILAEALAGMAYIQLVRPGAPVVFGSFASAVSMQSGAPT